MDPIRVSFGRKVYVDSDGDMTIDFVYPLADLTEDNELVESVYYSDADLPKLHKFIGDLMKEKGLVDG